MSTNQANPFPDVLPFNNSSSYGSDPEGIDMSRASEAPGISVLTTDTGISPSSHGPSTIDGRLGRIAEKGLERVDSCRSRSERLLAGVESQLTSLTRSDNKPGEEWKGLQQACFKEQIELLKSTIQELDITRQHIVDEIESMETDQKTEGGGGMGHAQKMDGQAQ